MILVVVAVGARAGFGGASGPLGSCDAEALFREWQKVAATEPSSPERARVARPIANALVECDKPLIGMPRAEVLRRLGAPMSLPETDPTFLYYDLGGDPRHVEYGDGLQLEFRSGRVHAAEVRP